MKVRTVAIVGSDSLLGQDVRHVLAEQAPDIDVKLIGEAIETTILTERDGEPVVVNTLDEPTLTAAQVVILAGSPKNTRESYEIVAKTDDRPAVIDLTDTLAEEMPEIFLRAPLVEPPESIAGGTIHQIAHPAAIVLAEFLSKLHASHPIRHSVIHVFEPASERGRDGIDELQKQTVNLLSFKPLPKEVFDAQLCYNLLPQYGGEAQPSLAAVESRIISHLKTLLARTNGAPAPSLRLVQAPVFHGYSFSVRVEFQSPAEVGDLIKSLAGGRIEVRSAEDEAPTNVGVAGQSGITVGRIEVDRVDPNSTWFWIVADNHRVAAENAVCLAQLLVPVEGSA